MCAPLEAGRENEELDTVKYTGVGGGGFVVPGEKCQRKLITKVLQRRGLEKGSVCSYI